MKKLLFVCLCVFVVDTAAQEFSQRGFVETRGIFYPQTAPNDSGQALDEFLLRYEPSVKFSNWFRIAGSFDARTDTHHETERAWRLDWRDRGLLRPAFSVRRLSAILHRPHFTVEAGRQFIRWGKADILNPTDRFAPRDFLSVVDNDFLAVTGVRATYENGANTLDTVWVPFFTPSRTPLLDQRWTVVPPAAQGVAFHDLGARFPGGSQFGTRWNHVAARFEYSLSFYQGFNHLPLFDATVQPAPPAAYVRRFYPTMRMFGGDAAVPLKWFTVKAEAAWFGTSTTEAEEYGLYVIQLERQTGEWSFVGGYAGEFVTRATPFAQFAPDRGFARAFLARAGYTIDTNRSVAFETALRQNGEGVWIKAEYSQALGQHWRATAAFVLIRGNPQDFLGQYRRNSHATLTFRYSF